MFKTLPQLKFIREGFLDSLMIVHLDLIIRRNFLHNIQKLSDIFIVYLEKLHLLPLILFKSQFLASNALMLYMLSKIYIF